MKDHTSRAAPITEQAEEQATEPRADEADEATTETDREAVEAAEPDKPKRRIKWSRVLAFGVLPAWRCCWPRPRVS